MNSGITLLGATRHTRLAGVRTRRRRSFEGGLESLEGRVVLSDLAFSGKLTGGSRSSASYSFEAQGGVNVPVEATAKTTDGVHVKILGPRQELNTQFVLKASTKFTFHAPTAGVYTIQVDEIIPDGVGRFTITLKSYDVSSSLSYVSFGGAGFHAVSSDPNLAVNGGAPEVYATKQWSAAAVGPTGGLGAPVLYAGGSTLAVSASWVLNQTVTGAGSIHAKGVGPGGIEVGPILLAQAGNRLFATAAHANSAFAKISQYHPDFKIHWELSFDDEKTWAPAGVSDNPLYVSPGRPIADPETGNLFLTVVDSAVKGTLGMSARPALIDATFREFAGLAMKRHDGTPLRYYGNPGTMNVTVSALLRDADGQCSTWTKLFLDMLLVDGIRADNDYVVLAPKHSDGFLVKSYAFSGGALGGVRNYPYINISAQSIVDAAGGTHRVAKVVDVARNVHGSDMLRGQNSPDPTSTFDNHQMAHLDGRFYDPSYGASFTSLGDIQNKAVAGYYKTPKGGIVLPAASLAITPKLTNGEVKVRVFDATVYGGPGADALRYRAKYSYGA